MPLSDPALAYALTRLPLPAGMLAAFFLGVLAGWSARRGHGTFEPPASVARRAVAAGVPLLVLVAALFVALARTWSRFDALEVAVGEEAGAALAIGRLASTLPPEHRAVARHHARAYLGRVAAEEFPAMARGEVPPAADAHLDALADLWARAPVAPAIAVEAFRALEAVHASRTRRADAADPAVPAIAFVLVIVALVASVRMASEVLVGPPAVRSLVMSLVVFTALAAALLIAQFSLPFAGDLTIDADPFVDAANALAERP
jgi:hypothetical protein